MTVLCKETHKAVSEFIVCTPRIFINRRYVQVVYTVKSIVMILYGLTEETDTGFCELLTSCDLL